MKLKKNLKFDRNLHFKERHISSDSRFFYIKFWITNIKKLVSNMYTNLPPSCKLFWFEFCIWNILVEMPNTRYKFVVYMVVFLPPERTQCTWKSKKSRKNLTTSMASMATTALGKILLSWLFFFLLLQQLGLLIFTFVQVCCVRSRAQQSWRKWWFVVM